MKEQFEKILSEPTALARDVHPKQSLYSREQMQQAYDLGQKAVEVTLSKLKTDLEAWQIIEDQCCQTEFGYKGELHCNYASCLDTVISKIDTLLPQPPNKGEKK